ncbi:MAG: heat-shock protein Hsp20 [Desulfobacterales bacterium]|nr:MAG: heat-shock protein Hsp20 [Desulfobacterales bacterium]
MTQQELQVKEKSQVQTAGESTKPGIRFTPAVDIFENDKEITLLADMPGVTAEGLEIDLRDNTLTLEGDVEPFEKKDELNVLTEFEVGQYWRQFTLTEVINQSKIEANLNNGVLRLTLPKVEKAQPRKIKVTVV